MGGITIGMKSGWAVINVTSLLKYGNKIATVFF